jgi:lipopolysaccharide export system permease protein
MILGVLATLFYNPFAAALQEKSKRLELQIFGGRGQSGLQATGTGFWLRQKSSDGQSVMRAVSSSDQGLQLGGVTVFTFDREGHYRERIEAKTASLEPGLWRLTDARVYGGSDPPTERKFYDLKTNIEPAQVRESFSTPDAVSFWELPAYIRSAEMAGLSAAGYRLQYHKLIVQPFLLAAMVLIAAAVSLRFFRFGGVQKMVIAGILSGFMLYVLSKVTDDLSKSNLMPPPAAAWLPAIVGGLIGLVALLYQEDG